MRARSISNQPKLVCVGEIVSTSTLCELINTQGCKHVCTMDTSLSDMQIDYGKLLFVLRGPV